MQNIEQFVKERQEIKPLQTCESYFLLFKTIQCLSYKICLTKKPVQVDTRFYADTYIISTVMYAGSISSRVLARDVLY